MAGLKERLRSDLTASMRVRDELRTATIRMVLTAVTNSEVAGSEARVLSEDDVLAVLAKEAKKRREAADAFREGGRAESAAREEAEAGIIAGYLPVPLTDEEIAAMVDQAVAEAGAETPPLMGKGLKALQPQVA